MAKEIVNRVANSKLVTIDLEELYPKEEKVLLDIKDWLFNGFVLREKDFRDHVSNHDWSQYTNQYVALHCSTDAIIPSWAYLLITTELSSYAKQVVVGDLTTLHMVIFTQLIDDLDVSPYQDKMLLLKGCTSKPIPETAYIQLMQKLMPVAKKIMYGEACSNVPLYRK